MDSQRRSEKSIFDNPHVIVGGYQEYAHDIEGACSVIFGRVLTPEDFAELIVAPDGSELLVTATYSDSTIELRLGYRWFNGTHDYLIYVADGRRIVEIENVYLKDDAPYLFETELFARQVKSFRSYGIEQIRLFAAGYPGDPGRHIGYYFWPRVGFVMYLGNIGAKLESAGLDYCDNTLELFSQPGGADWWYSYGREGEAVFYLYSDSPCLLALQEYLTEKELDINVTEE